MDQGLTIENVDVVSNIGPALSENEVSRLGELIDLGERQGLFAVGPSPSGERRELRLQQTGPGEPGYRLQGVTRTPRFCFTDPADDLLEAAQCGADSISGARTAARAGGQPPQLFTAVEGGPYTLAVPGKGRIEIHLRSTQGVFQYLGEVMRAELLLPPQERYVPQVIVDGNPEALLLVVTDDQGRGEFASVEYQGEEFVVPAESAGRSTQVLGFLSLLLAQKSTLGQEGEGPSPTPVRPVTLIGATAGG